MGSRPVFALTRKFENRITIVRQATLFAEHGGLPFPRRAPGLSDDRRSVVRLSTVVILFVTCLAYTQILGVTAAQETTALDARTLEQEGGGHASVELSGACFANAD